MKLANINILNKDIDKQYESYLVYDNTCRTTIYDFEYNKWDDHVFLDELLDDLNANQNVIILGMRLNTFFYDESKINLTLANLSEIFKRNSGLWNTLSTGESGRPYTLVGFMKQPVTKDLIELWQCFEFFTFFPVHEEIISSDTLYKYDIFSFGELKRLLIEKKTKVMITKLEDDGIALDYTLENIPSFINRSEIRESTPPDNSLLNKFFNVFRRKK